MNYNAELDKYTVIITNINEQIEAVKKQIQTASNNVSPMVPFCQHSRHLLRVDEHMINCGYHRKFSRYIHNETGHVIRFNKVQPPRWLSIPSHSELFNIKARNLADVKQNLAEYNQSKIITDASNLLLKDLQHEKSAAVTCRDEIQSVINAMNLVEATNSLFDSPEEYVNESALVAIPSPELIRDIHDFLDLHGYVVKSNPYTTDMFGTLLEKESGKSINIAFSSFLAELAGRNESTPKTIARYAFLKSKHTYVRFYTARA